MALDPTGAPGVMPGPGEMPGGAPAGYAPEAGVVSPAVAATEDEAAESPGIPGAEGPAAAPPAAAAAPPPAPEYPPTPQQHEIVQAAQQFMAAGQRIASELPQVQVAKQTIEAQLLPYAQNPTLFEQSPYEVQQAVRAGYQRWQQLQAREAQLQQGWQQIEQHTPLLQQMWENERRAAVLNKVGEPVAYDLLARRAAQRSGDPNFPIDEMTEFLKGTPAAYLEKEAEKYETLYRRGRLRERAAAMVDATGPGGASSATATGPRKGGRALLSEAIHDELRVRPPR